MKPKQIKIVDKSKLNIKWNNDTENQIALKYLRDECPCATCKGETVLLKTYRPAVKNINENSYLIKNIEQVGGYAIQITWKDGHNTGIYSWEYLQTLAADEDKGTTHNYEKLL
ncbi:MAG: DUF971 domain-containing protein [Ignavibacteriaceae bacterium]|nr:DUF971 domain-containing protein [Ignavibacteriaceae bacterium]